MQATTVKFEVHDQNDGCFLVRCHGGLSWEDRDVLAASVDDHIGDCAALRGVVLDLSTVEYVNSAGLGALFQLVRRLRERHARLVFANTPPTLSRLFKIVGLDTVGELCEDVEAALATLRRSPAPQPQPVPRRTATKVAARSPRQDPRRRTVAPASAAGRGRA
jgi:anti-anti-sigma factor